MHCSRRNRKAGHFSWLEWLMASDVPFAEFPKMGVLIKGRFNAKQQTNYGFPLGSSRDKIFPPSLQPNFFRRQVNCQKPPLKILLLCFEKTPNEIFLEKNNKNGFKKKNPTPGYAPPFSGTSPGPQVSLMGGAMKGGMVCNKKETGSSPSIIFFGMSKLLPHNSLWHNNHVLVIIQKNQVITSRFVRLVITEGFFKKSA